MTALEGGFILIAEDEPDNQVILQTVVESLVGARSCVVGDGLAVLASVERERPRMILLDLMMPRVDGFDVLRSIRADPHTRDLPVIVVTAKDLTDDDRARLRGAAQRVLTKQALSMDELRGQVRDLLRSHRARTDGSTSHVAS